MTTARFRRVSVALYSSPVLVPKKVEGLAPSNVEGLVPSSAEALVPDGVEERAARRATISYAPSLVPLARGMSRPHRGVPDPGGA
jgi:hypothetical protein